MCAETHSSPTRSRGQQPGAILCSDPETEERRDDRGRGTAPQKGLPLPLLPSSLPSSSFPPRLCLSLIFTPQYSVQSGREVLTTGSQGAHPEVPEGFLALTSVTEAV